MNILVVSSELIAASICHKLIVEGHILKLYISKEGWKDCLNGIIPKTEDWKDELSWVGKDGLIIFDDVCFGAEQDKLRSEGYQVIGGSAGGDKLELDREFFQNLLKSLGSEVLPSHNFDSCDKAIEYINKNPGKWVVKQNEHLGMLCYVGEHEAGKDTISVIETYRKYSISSVHLQKQVTGIEVGIARYFNGNDWVGPIEINHEHKRLCNDDIGPLTHEMGTVIWYSQNEKLPLFDQTLSKLKSHLQKINYIGDIDINCIVTKDKIWPLEATSRFGNPSTPLHCEMHTSCWGDFLTALARGEKYDLKYKDEFGVVVSIAVPPFPNPPERTLRKVDPSASAGLFYKRDLTKEEETQIHLEEISIQTEGNESNRYWAGNDGWVMHVTGSGSDIQTARTKAYNLIDEIILPRKFYRTDIGNRVEEKDLPQLKKWGWI